MPEGSRYHNGATLPLEGGAEARRLVSRVEQALALADADAAAAAVRELRARDSVDLLPFGPRTHVPALELALRRVAAADVEEALARVDADVARAADAALAERDHAALTDLALRGASLPSARRAALGAARLLFERGEWWQADVLAARAGDGADATALRALIAARRPAAAGPPDDRPADPTALRWSHAFPAWHRWLPPSEPAVGDGRPGELLVVESEQLTGMSRGPPAEDDGSESMSSRRVLRRDGSIARLAETLGSVEWPLPDLARGGGAAPARPRRVGAARAGDRLVVALDIVPDAGLEVREHHARAARLLALDLARPERPAWVVTAADGAADGDADADGADSEQDASSVFGPPVIDGDRVYALLFRTGLQTEVSLLCVDLADGARRFETPLVRGSAITRYALRRRLTDWDALDKRAPEAAPLVADGVVHACTGFGAVAAVDALTGRPLHLFLYDRLFPLDPDVYDAAYLVDTGGWNDEPPRLWNDRLVVAPSDSRYLYVLAREPGPAGHLILDDPVERMWRRHVVGLLPDPFGRPSPALLFTELRAGRFRLVLTEAGGHVLASSPPLPPGERVDLGGAPARPLLLGGLEGAALVPTSAGIRAYTVLRLLDPPALLDRPQGLPPVLGVHAVTGGLVGLSPLGSRQMYVECWTEPP